MPYMLCHSMMIPITLKIYKLYLFYIIMKWEGISLYQKIANVNMKYKTIEGYQIFKTCLKNVKENRKDCLEQKCIIAKLIIALENRGARL